MCSWYFYIKRRQKESRNRLYHFVTLVGSTSNHPLSNLFNQKSVYFLRHDGCHLFYFRIYGCKYLQDLFTFFSTSHNKVKNIFLLLLWYVYRHITYTRFHRLFIYSLTTVNERDPLKMKDSM